MREIFSYDGLLGRVLCKFADCILLSILWIICCMPVITVGAATAALYYTVNKVIRHDRGGCWQAYWQAFRVNFKQATIVWMLLLLIFGFLIANLYCTYILYLKCHVSVLFLGLLIAIVVAAVMWAIFLFPCIARFDNKTTQQMKNCLFFMMGNFLWSVLLLAVFFVVVAAALLYPLSLLFLPAVYMLTINFILERIFKKYMSPKDLAEEDERNRIYSEDESDLQRG